MFSQPARRAWVCARCLSKIQKPPKRRFTGLAQATVEHPPNTSPVTHSSNNPRHDDDHLRKIFDSPAFWKAWKERSTQALNGKKEGLLRNQYLTGPEGFHQFSVSALTECQKSVDKILAASTVEEYKGLVKELDRLSDRLCRVIDSVDFVRNVHPDARIQEAAGAAHFIMFNYMNQLNTEKGLEDQLKKASSIPEVSSSWTDEEKATAKILLKDFAQSATTGPEEHKRKFIEVSDEISNLGSEILDRIAPERHSLEFPSSKLKPVDPMAVKEMTSWGKTTVPTNSTFANLALKSADDAEVRKEIYMASRTASRSSILRVERLMQKRAELARLSGHESFAHLALSDKMAQSPEAVNKFLEALALENKAHVNQDLVELTKLKQLDGSTEPIKAWDRAYYTRKILSGMSGSYRPADVLSSYFSIGTVIQGLSRLFNRLYGIRLVPSEATPGETWNDDVRRLDVIDETEGHIAVLYCDLFERANKSPNPAHFTLRCSREIHPEEIASALGSSSTASSSTVPLTTLSAAVNDGMSLNRDPRTGRVYQLPTVAFICDFPRPSSSSSRPALLTFRQVSTLFHEMGHALHSILGRTTLQNVSGTRCATDFAELPSVLMEHFAAAPSVLALFARHWETDAPLNVDLVKDDIAAGRRLQAAAETEAQILFSVLDQRFHSAEVPLPGLPWDSTAVYGAVWNNARFASVPEPKGARWQGFFGHLVGYGAVYYSYLFDRAIAGRVWKDVFDGGDAAVDRERGQRYRDQVLRWGGARDGWRCVSGVLGDDKEWMANGGEMAMMEVGRWGAGEFGDAGAVV